MSNISIRGLDEEVARALKKAAAQRGLSLNAYAVELLRRGAGFALPERSPEHHDLDALAGTWTPEEAREMEAQLGAFEQIDEELWR